MFSSVPYVMIGSSAAPFKTVPELLAYAKANPATVNFGVPNGAPPHMLAEMFKASTGADIQVVPYRGASTLITDMLAGRIHGGFETTSVMFGHLTDRKIRGLAVVRESRIPEIADVPTLLESGITGVEASSWSGVLAPVGTPPEIIARLHAETVAALRSPEVADKLKLMAAEPKIMSSAEFGAFVASEYQRISKIMRKADIKAQ
jgi:tripartite-type tricarboxylate transporter receptor subunit TctC